VFYTKAKNLLKGGGGLKGIKYFRPIKTVVYKLLSIFAGKKYVKHPHRFWFSFPGDKAAVTRKPILRRMLSW
jgi:hypothetical protein